MRRPDDQVPALSLLRKLGAALTLTLALSGPLSAQNRPGVFDHYILALTWMPAFCAAEGEARGDVRCAPGSRNGWMVHGLWPQHRGGTWPEYCQTAERAPNRRETAEQADLFGASGAAWHQWNKHGRCTGLSAAAYYALTRQALERLDMPAIFRRIDQPLSVSPDVIEAAFVEENPGLTGDMMVTTCRRDTLVELRVCLTRDLDPRPCDAEVRSCSLRSARLLPLR
jgi:ribonuclease T2